MDCNIPGSSVHGIFQARVLEWAAIAFSKINLGGSQNYNQRGIRPECTEKFVIYLEVYSNIFESWIRLVLKELVLYFLI